MRRRKLVPLTALVSRTVHDELLRAAKRNERSLSSQSAMILTDWIFTNESNKETEKKNGVEEKI